MNSVRRTLFAAAMVFASGITVTFAVTDGWCAWTLESARRLHALRSPTPVPDIELESADGGHTDFSALRGEVLLVDFIYTHCATYCATLGSVYTQLQARLAPEIAAGKVRLVSVTFDPARDDAAALRAYRKHHSSGTAGWDLYRTKHAEDLKSWLTAFGVVVIPDRMGGYAHNAAIHVVGPNRKVVAILDPTDVAGAVTAARSIDGENFSARR